MFANLLGQKEYYRLTDRDMATIIGVSRASYESKIKSGRFTPSECAAFVKFFNKPFDFLFAEEPLDRDAKKVSRATKGN